MKEMLKETGIVLFVCLLFALMLVIFTPLPVSSLVHQLFAKGGPATEPANYTEVLAQTKEVKDLPYDSDLPANRFDLITPKEGANFPVVIWIHGGAYVGGQKEDLSIYARTLAAKGYAVANVEYDLAPASRYPAPLIQVSELYQTLTTLAQEYSLDLSRIILAGDSAGGQIAAQFANVQVAPARTDLAALQVIPAQALKGVVLFCAPLSLELFEESEPSLLVNFFAKRILWAYSGSAAWADSTFAQEGDVVKNLNAAFPPTFISDGNEGSFESHGRALAERLSAQGTAVTTAFYPRSEGKLTHEYQFDFTLPAAQTSFDALVTFLKGLEN